MVNYPDLEHKIFTLIFGFSERIDEMETRSEENCRRLAARIVALLKEELSNEATREKGTKK
jgi:hypothetical protein